MLKDLSSGLVITHTGR